MGNLPASQAGTFTNANSNLECKNNDSEDQHFTHQEGISTPTIAAPIPACSLQISNVFAQQRERALENIMKDQKRQFEEFDEEYDIENESNQKPVKFDAFDLTDSKSSTQKKYETVSLISSPSELEIEKQIRETCKKTYPHALKKTASYIDIVKWAEICTRSYPGEDIGEILREIHREKQKENYHGDKYDEQIIVQVLVRKRGLDMIDIKNPEVSEIFTRNLFHPTSPIESKEDTACLECTDDKCVQYFPRMKIKSLSSDEAVKESLFDNFNETSSKPEEIIKEYFQWLKDNKESGTSLATSPLNPNPLVCLFDLSLPDTYELESMSEHIIKPMLTPSNGRWLKIGPPLLSNQLTTTFLKSAETVACLPSFSSPLHDNARCTVVEVFIMPASEPSIISSNICHEGYNPLKDLRKGMLSKNNNNALKDRAIISINPLIFKIGNEEKGLQNNVQELWVPSFFYEALKQIQLHCYEGKNESRRIKQILKNTLDYNFTNTKFELYERNLDLIIAERNVSIRFCKLFAFTLILNFDVSWYSSDWGEDDDDRPPIDDFFDDLGTTWKSITQESAKELDLGHNDFDKSGSKSKMSLSNVLDYLTLSFKTNFCHLVCDEDVINFNSSNKDTTISIRKDSKRSCEDLVHSTCNQKQVKKSRQQHKNPDNCP